jgi:hypothetical protein
MDLNYYKKVKVVPAAAGDALGFDVKQHLQQAIDKHLENLEKADPGKVVKPLDHDFFTPPSGPAGPNDEGSDIGTKGTPEKGANKAVNFDLVPKADENNTTSSAWVDQPLEFGGAIGAFIGSSYRFYSVNESQVPIKVEDTCGSGSEKDPSVDTNRASNERTVGYNANDSNGVSYVTAAGSASTRIAAQHIRHFSVQNSESDV